jgi:YaiO family outer membrane protein
VELSRQTDIGPVVVRGARAQRFSMTDEQVEVEFYPVFRPGTYAYVGAGFGPDHVLFPEHRAAFDLYQSLGAGVEISGGFRRLAFAEVTNIYLAALTKYAGRWMLTGKVYRVPEGAAGSTSYHGQVRRYVGGDDSSFIGFGYGHGLSREEVRNVGDLMNLNFDSLRGQLDATLSSRWRVQLDLSTSRQKRTLGRDLWQTTLSTGFGVRF